MTAPELPLPRDAFAVDYLARWPMGAERVELDEDDAAVARRTFLVTACELLGR